ncbi:MAG: hypothetical protein J6V76_03245 [Bacteroidales bacterium]|nr:hypothetical protein [Bacteroidales bacterium]
MLALFFAAMSCKKDDTKPNNNEPIEEEEEKYETVPFSIIIGITPMKGSVDGVDLKQAFDDGDEIEISNSQVLYEPLILSAKGCAGKTSAQFSGEMKVNKGAELVSGSTKFTAALKNGTKYNNGKPFVDVKKVSSFAEGLEKYSYWACEDFTYNADATSVSLVQSTIFLNVNLLGTKLTMKYGQGFYNEVVSGNFFYAIPFGTTLESEMLNLKHSFDVKDKSFYRLGCPVPEECIRGLFSVGDNKYVLFSSGNLQYRPMDGSWRLAPQQYHRCFTARMDVGEDYANWKGEDKWADLFKCGTLDESIKAYGSEWSTLSIDEWEYLITLRPDALQKSGGAIVDNVYGWILLPDDWVAPDGVPPFDGLYSAKYYKDVPNQYTKEEWSIMESAGAVFLPETGELIGTTFYNSVGAYQSLSLDATNNERYVFSFLLIDNVSYFDESYSTSVGLPIRLVQPLNPTVKVE